MRCARRSMPLAIFGDETVTYGEMATRAAALGGRARTSAA